MTIQGIGASLSPAIGGWIAQELGYGPMFLVLGGFAVVSVALWVAFAALLKPACAMKPGRASDEVALRAAGIA